MEIKQYLLIIRKWLWLLILGGIIGGAIGYLYTIRLPTLYRASSIAIVELPNELDFSYQRNYQKKGITDYILLQFRASENIQSLNAQLGYPVSAGQINVTSSEDSFLLNISATDGNPLHAAQIANTLVPVINNNIEAKTASRNETALKSMQNQITQVEGQIVSLQDELAQINQKTEVLEQEEYQQQISELKTQLDLTESDIIKVEAELEAFFPISLPTSTPQTNFSSTATPVPTPTLSPAALVNYKETQNRLDQLSSIRDLYKQAYTNLLVLGTNSENANSTSRQARQEQIQTTLSLYQQLYTNLLNSYEVIRLESFQDKYTLVQLNQASVPTNPIQPQPFRATVSGMVSGVLLMGAVAFLIEYLDDSLKTPEDVQQYLGIPVVGMVGEMEGGKRDKINPAPGVFIADNPLSPVGESLRALRTNLEFFSVDQPLKSLIITSANPSVGKTTLAVNLAAAISYSDRRVILVDADLRRPTLHRYFEINNRKGLSDLFTSPLEPSDVAHTWGDPAIKIITSGALPPNPTELLSSNRMDTILEEMRKLSDIIVIDTSPSVVSDSVALSAKVDGVLVVIEPGKTTINQAREMLEHLRRAKATVLGAVLNPVSHRQGYYYSRYTHPGKNYYHTDQKDS